MMKIYEIIRDAVKNIDVHKYNLLIQPIDDPIRFMDYEYKLIARITNAKLATIYLDNSIYRIRIFDHINHMKYLDVKYEWVLDDYDLNIIKVL